jgi:mannose-6-phosphate isomerase-like protein (cupin superfamily)
LHDARVGTRYLHKVTPTAGTSDEARARWVGATQTVTKPWGHELIFANVPGGFAGKELHVRAGQSLSMQYHEHKEEVLAVRSGRIQLEIGPSADALDRIELVPGDTVHIRPGTVHRTTALEDSIVLEASTYHPDDVVRLDDLYGRAGTSSP